MTKHPKAAKRYAKALFELATEGGQIEPVREEVLSLQALIRQSPDLARFLTNAALGHRSLREQALRALFQKLHPLVLRFLLFLERQRRLGLLDDVCASFLARYDEVRQLVRGRLSTPFPLERDQVESITGRIQRRVRGQLSLSAETDTSLLGGFRVQVGDEVYDASVATRLRALRRGPSLASQPAGVTTYAH